VESPVEAGVKREEGWKSPAGPVAVSGDESYKSIPFGMKPLLYLVLCWVRWEGVAVGRSTSRKTCSTQKGVYLSGLRGRQREM